MDNGESPFLNKDATRFLENAVRENNVTKATKFLEAGASAFISYEMIDKKQYEMIDVMHKDNPKLIRYSQLLHHACAKSDAEMIDFLIERGASLDLYGYHVGLFCDFINNCSTDIYAIPPKLKGTKKCNPSKGQI